MRRVSDGYTIIEVMIFLAISVFIAGAAMNLISGKQSETDFNQKMRDTQSKLQDWINDVSTGFTGGDPSQQHCAQSGPPYIQSGAPSSVPNYSPACTFLGKVIQFTDKADASQDSSLYTYSVFGCRLIGCNANGTLPATMRDANPEPAVGQSGVNLTESFSLAPAYVSSVCSMTQSQASCSKSSSSHLVGFMNSFNSGQNPYANGAEDLNVYLYNLNANAVANQTTGAVVSCIEGNSSSPCSLSSTPDPPSLKSYVVCLTDGRRTAEITISSGSGIGASVQLVYTACT